MKLNGRELKALFILSIVAPVGILISLRLTGILQEPITITETMTLETVKWEFERPYALIDFEEKDQSFYDDDAAIVQSIEMDLYDPDDWEYGGSSRVSLTLNITSSVPVGYIYNIHLTFYENYENARINFLEEHQLIKLQNLSITGFKDWAREVFINLSGINRPGKVSFWAPIHWVLRSPNNQTHLLDLVSEIVYFNGTAYKKVVQPFQLKIAPDNNDSFETAQEIREGYYPRLYIGPPDVGDIRDYYRIYAVQGQRLRAYVHVPLWRAYVNGTWWRVDVNGTWWPTDPPAEGFPTPDFGLYLYDPNRNLVVAKEPRKGFEIIDAVANSTGYWFIGVRIFENFGFYSIGVNQ